MKKQYRKLNINLKYHNKNSDFDGLEIGFEFDGSTLDDSNYSDTQLSYDNKDLIEVNSDDE